MFKYLQYIILILINIFTLITAISIFGKNDLYKSLYGL